MHCASIHRPAGHWPKEKAAGSVTLDFDARHRRRIRLTTDQGEDVLLDLPKAIAMANGDGLQLDDGRLLKVQAAAELIIEVRHKDPNQLMRLAWHLGNRHLPTEIRDRILRIRKPQANQRGWWNAEDRVRGSRWPGWKLEQR